MTTAVFNSNLTYLPSGGGMLSQALNLSGAYRAVSAGSVPVPAGTVVGTVIEIPFGDAASDCRAVLVRNETPIELGMRINDAEGDLYRLAPGAVFLHWSPAEPGSKPPWRITLSVTRAVREAGTIGFVVLGG